MFFNTPDLAIKIKSVHLLTWEQSDVIIPPKKTFDLSFRELGDARFEKDDGTVEAKTGDICYFPKGSSYHFTAGKERLYAINFHAEGKLSERIEKFTPKNYARFQNEFMEIYHIWTRREDGYYLRALSILYKILSNIEKERAEDSELPIYKKLKPALEMLNSSFVSADLSIADLASHIGVSDTYFRRIFEKCIGQKPLDYLNKLRIDYAKELLQSGFYNIESVAAMCGFRDPKYFSTVFKRVRGISPSEYKKKFS